MANFKYDRIAQDLKIVINNVINDKMDDLDFVTIVEVELTKDLADAKVYVTCMSATSQEYVLKTLEKKKGFIKREITKSLKIRKIPNLIFKYDSSLENYNKIEELLKK